MLKWLMVFALFSSCAHRISRFYPEIVPAKPTVSWELNAKGGESLRILYMGCGNLVLEKDGEAIMTDPFFSRQGPLKLLGKIKTDPEAYRLWKNTYESFLARSVVKAGFVAHTHYDHVMDLPTLIEDHYFLQMKEVYGNAYLPKMLQHFDDQGVSLNALTDDQVFDPDNPSDAYQWIDVTPRIRVLPIKSSHAPHTKKKLYMDDPLDEEYFDEHLVWSNSKVKAFKWTTGTTYSFLVDFIGEDTLRIFVQTSASEAPDGFPPAGELKEKKVDLALLCYASTPNVTRYPNAIVEKVGANKLMLVHWEDFFRQSKSFNDQKLVRRTKPREVRQRIDQLKLTPEDLLMPRPGTLVTVKY